MKCTGNVNSVVANFFGCIKRRVEEWLVCISKLVSDFAIGSDDQVFLISYSMCLCVRVCMVCLALTVKVLCATSLGSISGEIARGVRIASHLCDTYSHLKTTGLSQRPSMHRRAQALTIALLELCGRSGSSMGKGPELTNQWPGFEPG